MYQGQSFAWQLIVIVQQISDNNGIEHTEFNYWSLSLSGNSLRYTGSWGFHECVQHGQYTKLKSRKKGRARFAIYLADI